MKKRKILMLTLPLVGVATIVGSGFSAWYFNSTEVTPLPGQIGVSITNKTTTTGTLSSDLGSATLVLDQGGSKTEDANNPAKHIWVERAGTKISAFTISFTIPEASATALAQSNVKGQLKVVATVNETLAKYVAVDTSSWNVTKDMMFGESDVLTTSWTRTVSENNMVYTLTLSVLESTGEGSPFKYTVKNEETGTLGKPTTVTEYDAMKAAIGTMADGISFTTSVAFIPY